MPTTPNPGIIGQKECISRTNPLTFLRSQIPPHTIKECYEYFFSKMGFSSINSEIVNFWALKEKQKKNTFEIFFFIFEKFKVKPFQTWVWSWQLFFDILGGVK